MLKNTISLVILTFCLTCFTNLLSEPHRVFGDEGTFLYSNPMHELLGIHSILGGEEVMVFWSENRLEDGFRGVYLQVVNETGEFRYENPIRLTLENMTSDDGMVTKDGEGNLYVAWSATIPEDGAEKILFVQKYDGDGDPLWGDEPRGIISFESELNKRTLIGLIPDDHGGVYALSNWGFIALDENCQLRRDWEWNERRPDPEHDRLHSAISDDHGGFWYIASVDRSIMNRITYEGEKLWEEMRPIANDEFPEGAVVNNPLCGLNGGLLLRYRQTEGNHRRVGIFRMDENGEFVGEEFSHVIQEIDGHIDIDVEKLREGRIAILYKKRPTDEDPEVWLTIYDPDENEFVNSNQGVQVVSWNSWGIRLVGVTEHTNGDLTLKIGLSDSGRYLGECFLYSNNLERRRRDSVLIPNLGNAKFGTYAADNGVWLFGYKTNTLPRQPLLLYRLNQNGNYEDLWPVHPVRSNRNYRPYGGIIWESGNNYHNLYEGTSNWERGICHLALDSTGQFTGDPEGVNLTETNTTRNLKTKMAGNRIIRGWRHQTSYTPVLSCFTDEPELEWNIEFDTPLISHDTGLEIDMAPNGEFTYLFARSSYEEPVHYYLYAMNSEDGGLAWSDSFAVNIHRSGTLEWILAVEDGVYLAHILFGSYIEIRKYDTDGNLVWEQPYRDALDRFDDDVLIGVSKRSEGGIWFGKQIFEEGGSNIEFHGVNENGEEVGNPLTLYDEPINSLWEGYTMPGDSGPLWVVHSGDRLIDVVLVQGISEIGERLLSEDGFRPREIYPHQTVHAYSDGDGGVWFGWGKNDSRCLSVVHFKPDGVIMEGWTNEGIDAFQTPFNAGFTYTYPMDDKLAIISRNRDYNPFDTSHEENYVIQILTDREPNVIGNQDPNNIPDNLTLLAQYPNPFNSTTRIEYYLPETGQVRIAIYNLNGCQMDILTNGELAAGIYATSWDASGVPTGVYLCRLEAGGETVTRKLMVLR